MAEWTDRKGNAMASGSIDSVAQKMRSKRQQSRQKRSARKSSR
jgi:hypothetical protein